MSAAQKESKEVGDREIKQDYKDARKLKYLNYYARAITAAQLASGCYLKETTARMFLWSEVKKGNLVMQKHKGVAYYMKPEWIPAFNRWLNSGCGKEEADRLGDALKGWPPLEK